MDIMKFMDAKEVITVGSAILDIMMQSDEFRVLKSHEVNGGMALCEVLGGKTDIDKMLVAAGGGATNCAVSMERKGINAGCIAKVGDDDIGRMLMAKLKEEGMDTGMMVVEEGGQTGMSVVMVAADGGRSILTFRGVSKELTAADIKWEGLKCKWLYVSSLGGNMSLLEDLLTYGFKCGIKVAVNPGKAELSNAANLKRLLKYAEVLLVNRMELSGLTGIKYEAKNELEKAAGELTAKTVVVTEGKNGAWAVAGGRKWECNGFKVKSVDDTGAGDAFGSGFVYGMIKGWPVDKCLKAGAANGAAEVTQVGAKSGLLTEAELLKWMEKPLTVKETTTALSYQPASL